MDNFKYRLIENDSANGYKYDLQFGITSHQGEVKWHTFLLFKNEDDAISALDELMAA